MGRDISVERLIAAYGQAKWDKYVKRFWAQVAVDESSPNSCWPWLSKSVASSGKNRDIHYGKSQLPDGSTARANRISVAIAAGLCPGDRVVMHGCSNSLCVRPSHLSLGTQKENMALSRALGNSMAPTERGGWVKSHSKLTPAHLALIRQWASEGVDYIEMGIRLGVTARSVKRALLGETHKNVDQSYWR